MSESCSRTKTRSQEGIEIDEGFVEDFEREKLKQRVIGFTRGCYSINAQQREESKSRGRGEKSLVIEPRGKFQPCGKTELTTRIVKKKLKKKGTKRGGEKKRGKQLQKSGKRGIKAFSRRTLAVGEIEIF